ncbi:hypothetical protein PILCRDRAFT_15899 [Piloderma croceum F 1598]|uniref:Uncharacterized protein n=1 Tax=Piloderma croceum (strain F 1598) TaxID=765440 RepID=A0A0C3EXL0_PILCF|nr:hypothetical protein PILCRDRAFT_15899 [Piloderma croceum F 1598]
MLDKFEEHTKEHGILPKILQRLHDNGRIFAKADPLGNQHSHEISTVAFDAAIREYQNRNGDLSNHEDD